MSDVTRPVSTETLNFYFYKKVSYLIMNNYFVDSSLDSIFRKNKKINKSVTLDSLGL